MSEEDLQYDPRMSRIPEPPRRSQQPQMANPGARSRSDDMPQQRPAQHVQASQALGHSAARVLMAGLQNPFARFAGFAMMVYSVIATTLVIGFTDAILLTNNEIGRFVLGFFAGLFISIGQIVAIARPTKYGKDIWVCLVIIDAIYTARMNHQFTMTMMSTIIFAPIILACIMNYIGLIVLDWERSTAIATTVGIGVVLMIIQLGAIGLENKLVLDYGMYATDLVGAFWLSRLGEEAALGKRIQ